MKFYLPALLLSLLVGCGTPSDDAVATENNKHVALIKKTISKLMGIAEGQLDNDTPLSQLPAPMDDLDFIELVMELEGIRDVAISDQLLMDTASTND